MGSKRRYRSRLHAPSAIRRASPPKHPAEPSFRRGRSITERRLHSRSYAQRATPPTTLPCHEGQIVGSAVVPEVNITTAISSGPSAGGKLGDLADCPPGSAERIERSKLKSPSPSTTIKCFR